MPANPLPFVQLDVFAPSAFAGNPLAVVFGGEGLSPARMQAAAAWLGLSETTFVLPPTHAEADYRVRIFTPGGELPFAGHPTLGTCAAWLQRGGQPKNPLRIVQESALGLVAVRPLAAAPWDAALLAFAAPPVTITPVEVPLLQAVCGALGLASGQVVASAWLDNGPRWLALWLGAAPTVLALEPDHGALKALGLKVGVGAPHPAGQEAAIEVRAFAAATGVPEDPVTGSLNASLAQWLIGRKTLPARYIAAQGARVGRSGRVHIDQDDRGQVWVGGMVRAMIRGEIGL